MAGNTVYSCCNCRGYKQCLQCRVSPLYKDECTGPDVDPGVISRCWTVGTMILLELVITRHIRVLPLCTARKVDISTRCNCCTLASAGFSNTKPNQYHTLSRCKRRDRDGWKGVSNNEEVWWIVESKGFRLSCEHCSINFSC